jgi:hypothetical protein
MTAPGVYPVEPASAPPGGPDGEVPAPPRGPGVAPPFAAPPTDRNRRGLWIGLGVGGLVLVLCCVGGLFGFGLILVSGAEKVKTEAHQVVTDYLSALQREDYNKAYDLLCPAATAHESADDFAARERRQPHPLSYQVGQTQIGNTIVVPATVRFDSGDTRQLQFRLSQDTSTGDLKVCDVTG